MPYIKQEQRDQLDPAIYLMVKALIPFPPTDAKELGGRLNYVITRLLLETLPADYRYIDLRDAVAALEMAKLEFFRKKVAPYEDKKALENGDAYAS